MGQIVNYGVGFLTMLVGSQPIPIGVLKDVTIDESYTMKSLIGQSQFPLDIARGEGKLTGKATFASVNTLLMAQFMSGATTAAGNVAGVYLEGPAAPTPSPRSTARPSRPTWGPGTPPPRSGSPGSPRARSPASTASTWRPASTPLRPPTRRT